MKNIFVLGYDDFNLEQMKALPDAGDYRFHGLYAFSQLQAGTALPVDEVQRGALETLNAFPGSVDAVVGYWDCPVSTMLPLLRAPFGLPSPSLASVLKCEHKYWSRLEQKKVIPEYCPDFCAVDPFAERPFDQVTLDYPFWIKPIKSVSSHLGFKVRNRAEFDHAIELIRQGIYRYGDTFNHFLGQADLPDEVAGIDGRWCIAESIISRGALRAWMLDSMPPSTFYHQRFGRWVSEPDWPSANIDTRVFHLSHYRLNEEKETPETAALPLQSPLSNGLFAGKWCAYSATPDLPHDQREEDGGALTFTSNPLEEDLEILGAPEVEIELSSTEPVAMLAVRLSDVQPDNKATRVTYGLLNLTHRDGHESPTPLEPGQRYRVRIQLNDVGQTFPRGHRIRVALSTSYFPLAWPPPESIRLNIHASRSRLLLPVRAPRTETIEFPPAEGAAKGAHHTLTPGRHDWRVIRELDKDVSTLEVINDDGVYYLEEPDTVVKSSAEEWYSYQGDDFQSPRGETLWVRGLSRGDWSVETWTRTVLRCDTEHFYLDAELDAYEGDRRVFSKNWHRRIPRNLL